MVLSESVSNQVVLSAMIGLIEASQSTRFKEVLLESGVYLHPRTFGDVSYHCAFFDLQIDIRVFHPSVLLLKRNFVLTSSATIWQCYYEILCQWWDRRMKNWRHYIFYNTWQIVKLSALAHCINYKIMSLFAYWHWKLVNEGAISAKSVFSWKCSLSSVRTQSTFFVPIPVSSFSKWWWEVLMFLHIEMLIFSSFLTGAVVYHKFIT